METFKQYNEVMSRAARRKKSIAMKKAGKKIARAKERKLKKKATPEDLKKRAHKQENESMNKIEEIYEEIVNEAKMSSKEEERLLDIFDAGEGKHNVNVDDIYRKELDALVKAKLIKYQNDVPDRDGNVLVVMLPGGVSMSKKLYNESLNEKKSQMMQIEFPSTEKKNIRKLLDQAKVSAEFGVAPSGKDMIEIDADDWDSIKQDMKKVRYNYINEAKTFMRLPGHVIGNELYMAKRHMESIYSRLTDGNDYIDKEMTTLIKLLQSIRKESKSFGNADEVPRSYTWC